MNKIAVFIRGLVAVAALGLASSAALADGYYGSVKDGGRPFSWTGFYVGLNAGLATGQTKGDLGLGGFLNTDYDMSGSVYGGQVGYNWQSGKLVLGIEGTYSGSTVQGNTTCLFVFECKRQVDSVGTVVGRLGLAMDHSLLYVMGGGAWGKVNTDFGFAGINIASESQTHSGWVAGVGFEHALTNQISMRIEYAHIDFGSEQYFGFDKVDVNMDTVRLGVNYKFN